MDKKEKETRFDDTFKTLVIVATIALSACIALHRNGIETFVFVGMLINYAMVITLWAIANLGLLGEHEYSVKLFALYLLIVAMSVVLIRLKSGVTPLDFPQKVGITLSAFTVYLSVYLWMKESVPTLYRKHFWLLGLWYSILMMIT